MKLSVIVPFHNEVKNVAPVLDAYQALRVEYDFELIAVNDASTDGTGDALRSHEAHPQYAFLRCIDISPEEHRGYGHAIMQGVAQAEGEVIAWTHSDLQTDPADVFRAYALFQKSNDRRVLVKGNRVQRPWGQVLFSFGMAAYASLVLRRWFFEINAQPKLFPRSFLPYLKNAPPDFSLDLFLLYQAKRYGYTIKTIDVLFKKRIYGQSAWAFSFRSKVKTIKRTVAYIWRLRKNT
jgi:glycosyltransferase involved in cell wall biosynthesis